MKRDAIAIIKKVVSEGLSFEESAAILLKDYSKEDLRDTIKDTYSYIREAAKEMGMDISDGRINKQELKEVCKYLVDHPDVLEIVDKNGNPYFNSSGKGDILGTPESSTSLGRPGEPTNFSFGDESAGPTSRPDMDDNNGFNGPSFGSGK